MLATLGVLPSDFSREIAFSAGLRNRIVHEYDEIDDSKVYGALKAAVRDIPVYLNHVNRFIESLS
jgi:uncharacterized protein YutE (UPF0331/DUF86 family)